MGRVAAAGRAIGSAFLGIAIAVGAQGWLYLLRGPTVAWPGPKVPDALLLDELSGHASVSVLLFVLVWGGAAVLLGLVARGLAMRRPAAALVPAVGLGAFLYVLNAFLVYAVRQVPAGEALHQAARLQAVYVPAALAGIAGALLGRHRGKRPPAALPALA